jgi:transposase
MERIHMNLYKEIIYRLRAGESERSIAKDLGLSRPTVHKYHIKAELEGYLDMRQDLPGSKEILESLGLTPEPPRVPSTVEDYREVVKKYLEMGLKMTAIYHRLRDDHGYKGSYSSIKRFVRHLSPVGKEVFIRVHTEPGEVVQVDFGYVGLIYDPKNQRHRKAYVFVATLGYSRHQYAEIVFDQTIATWLGLHMRAFEHFGGVPQKVVPDYVPRHIIGHSNGRYTPKICHRPDMPVVPVALVLARLCFCIGIIAG